MATVLLKQPVPPITQVVPLFKKRTAAHQSKTLYSPKTEALTLARLHPAVSPFNKPLSTSGTKISQARLHELLEYEATAKRQATLIDALPAGLIILDSQGMVTECNPYAESLLGRPLVDEKWINIIDRVFNPRSDDGFEVSMKNGRRLSIATQALSSGQGQVLYIYDLTQTRALQAQASHQGRLAAMGRMAASLAHQIRTPLSSSLLYASHLRNSHLSEQARLRFSEKIVTGLKNIETQVRDMLLFMRGDTMKKSVLNMTALVNCLAQSMETQLEQAGAVLHVNLQINVPKFSGNQDAIIGALQNVINNAIEAGAEHDLQLVVNAGCEGEDKVFIEVQDNGPGIPDELINKVSAPFFTTKSQGTGLGLSVAHAVAKAHQGSLSLGVRAGGGCWVRFVFSRASS